MRGLAALILLHCATGSVDETFLAALETKDTDMRVVFARLCDALGGDAHAPIHRRALMGLFAETYLGAGLAEARRAQTALHTRAPGAELPEATEALAEMTDLLEQFFALLPAMHVRRPAAARLVERGSFVKFARHRLTRHFAGEDAQIAAEVLEDLSSAFSTALEEEL